MTSKTQNVGHGAFRMRSRQRVFRNFVALVGVGKAAVVGAGLALAMFGYVDLAQHFLPGEMIRMVVNGIEPEAVASAGGLLGVVVGLIVGLFR